MGVVELSGYPAINEVVEAWVSVAWVSVFWTGTGWRYHTTGRPVEYPITHWKALAGVKALHGEDVPRGWDFVVAKPDEGTGQP